VWLLLTVICALPLHGQASCSVSHPGNRQTRTCTVTLSTTLQLLANAQLVLSRSSTNIADPGALGTGAMFKAANDTGIVVNGPQLQASANRGISLTMVNAPQFTGPGAKPASDVRLGITAASASCIGVPVLPLSTSPLAVQQASPRVLLQTSAPSTGVVRQLCLRVFWRYDRDPPGSYSLPLTFSITAP
jgi:hypothetical protein